MPLLNLHYNHEVYLPGDDADAGELRDDIPEINKGKPLRQMWKDDTICILSHPSKSSTFSTIFIVSSY